MVFVDDMYTAPMGRFGRMKMSHMIADTEHELHAMAAKIGVARRWYQRDHYDVSMSMREKAIAFGAVPITMRQLGTIHIGQRHGLNASDVWALIQRHGGDHIGALRAISTRLPANASR